MRETRADTAQATALALLLHGLLFLLVFAGLWWTRPPVQSSAAGDPVSAELVDASALSAATLSELANRPEPVLEPEPLPPAPGLADAEPIVLVRARFAPSSRL